MVHSRAEDMPLETPNSEWPGGPEQPSLSQILAQLEDSRPGDEVRSSRHKDTSAYSEAGSSETDNPPAKRQLLSGIVPSATMAGLATGYCITVVCPSGVLLCAP